uniref:Centrosomal protein kizuna n=1 Tax=Cynoglossus semilaevis TaxID=244447 RepID=A0A3P8UDX7_CYNSE
MAATDNYYDKITAIQQSLHEREKRRLELERDLFAYYRSDKTILQIKSSKLRSYLKEISNREARAKMRNLELLRDVEYMENRMREYHLDHGSLQQQKAACLKRISEERKIKEMEVEAGKIRVRKRCDDSLSHPPKLWTPSPGVNVMENQTPGASDPGGGTTSVLSHQALPRSPSSSMNSAERPPGGHLKDSTVYAKDAIGNRTCLSDDISDSKSSPDGYHLSDKDERKMAQLPAVSSPTTVTCGETFVGDNEKEPLPFITSTRLEKNLSTCSNDPISSANSAAEEDIAQDRDENEATQRDRNHSTAGNFPEREAQNKATPRNVPEREAQNKAGSYDGASAASSDMELSESTASDLSLSLTQSEPEEELPDGEESDGDVSAVGSPDQISDGSRKTSPTMALQSLSQEALFYLLDSIEGRLQGERTALYGNSAIDGRRLNRLISLCNDGEDLNEEDLEACGAVVLHGLQRLSWSTATGGLLPQALVSSDRSSQDPEDISTSLPPDAARLWDRWFKHALLLKQHCVLNTERLVQLFTPLLLGRHASNSHQARGLLRTLLSRSSEERPSAEDKSDLSSSCDLFPLHARSDVKPARPIQRQQTPELQSAEEDSQDESPVESVPIRETKAYQLLKQSAMQKRLQSSEEEEEEEEELLRNKSWP